MKQKCKEVGWKSETFALKPTEAGNVVLSGVGRLFAEEKLVDVMITGKEMAGVKCHKLVLAAFSAYFESLLAGTEGSAILNLDSVGVEHSSQLRTIVNFMYGYNIHVHRKDSSTLLEAAKLFQVTALVKTLETKISKPGSETDLFVLKPTGISFLLLVNFQRFRREGKFVDARIGLADSPTQSYPAHKLVLASFSTYFESLLQGTESSAILGLESVDPLYIQQLPIILNYMYGEPVKLEEKQIVVLLDAARVFGIHSLEEGELIRLLQRAQKRSQQRTLKESLKRRRAASQTDSPQSREVQQEAIRRAWNARRECPNVSPLASLAPIQVSQSNSFATPPDTENGQSSVSFSVDPLGTSDSGTDTSGRNIVNDPSAAETSNSPGDSGLEWSSNSGNFTVASPYSDVPVAEGEVTIDPSCMDGSFMCSNCNILFNDTDSLNEHIASSHEDDAHERSKTFSLSYNSDSGENFEGGSNEPIDSAPPHKAQEDTVTGKPSARCPGCRLVFSHPKILKRHFAEEHDGLSNICSQCFSVLPSRSDLIQHLEQSHRAKVLHCEIDGCEKVFQSRVGLASHLQTHRKGVSAFNCSQCDYVGSNKNNLKNHNRSNHRSQSASASQKSVFPCSDCPRTFIYKSFLIRHFNKVHLKMRPFHCPNCDYAASEKGALQIHIRCVHTGEKPFQCKNCSEQFSTASHLSRHKRVHHDGVKVNVCKICAKEFVESRDLKVHVNRDHMEERPFSCPECSAAFYRKDHVLVHRRKVHGFKS